MENTARITIKSNSSSLKKDCEDIQTDISFVIKLSPERMLSLKDAIKNIDSFGNNNVTDIITDLLAEYQGTLNNIQPLSKLEAAVTTIMNELGIPAHTKGYRYLREAIVLSAENPDLIGQVTKTLYPAIARTHNTTPVRVERVIRHAIEYCCMKGNQDVVNVLFSHCLASRRGKPTNSEFIAIISDRLRMCS